MTPAERAALVAEARKRSPDYFLLGRLADALEDEGVELDLLRAAAADAAEQAPGPEFPAAALLKEASAKCVAAKELLDAQSVSLTAWLDALCSIETLDDLRDRVSLLRDFRDALTGATEATLGRAGPRPPAARGEG